MKRENKSKNISIRRGEEVFKRWTVLDISTKSVQIVKDHSEKYGLSMGKSLDNLIKNSKIIVKKANDKSSNSKKF